MSRHRKAGSLTDRLLLELFRKLPPERQREYLGGLESCVRNAGFRNTRNVLMRVEGNCCGVRTHGLPVRAAGKKSG